MSADKIAETVAKFKAGDWTIPDGQEDIIEAAMGLHGLSVRGPIVDLTAISEELSRGDKEIRVYEDHPCIAPPWDDAIFAWVGNTGRVRLIAMSAADRTIPHTEEPARWEPHESSVFDWDTDVKWVLTFGFWLDVGLRYQDDPNTIVQRVLSGPVHGWLVAVGHQGEPLDVHWIDLPHENLVIGERNGDPAKPLKEAEFQFMQTSLIHVLQALNFLNCSNVDITEPKRPRAERRRIERTGVHVHELTVYPRGTSTRSLKGESLHGTPLHSVRGHFSEYGPKYNKGLLFGKYEGRFWVPQHARGSAEHGVDVHDYKLVEPQ